MNELQKYVRERLKDELKIIQQGYTSVLHELNPEEKALIYWYSEGGYIGVNELLRDSKGKKNTKLGEYLDIALSKLPNFRGITFRGTYLTNYEISKYQQALDVKAIITEHSFTSTSRVKNQADQYRKTAMFEIFSKKGKLIEKGSKFVKEQEILFRKDSQFHVLGIEKHDSYVYITLREI